MNEWENWNWKPYLSAPKPMFLALTSLVQAPYTPRSVLSRPTLGPGDVCLAGVPQGHTMSMGTPPHQIITPHLLWYPHKLQLFEQNPLCGRQGKPGLLRPAGSQSWESCFYRSVHSYCPK